MTRFHACSLLLVVASLCTGGTAAADVSASSRAQVLFEEGRRLMAVYRFDEACAKLAESQKLDPGAGTLLNLAACYEKGGRFASAWATYTEAASSADRSGRAKWRKKATDKVAALRPHLSTLTILVPTPIDGLEITRDGTTLAGGEIGIKVPIDGGEHVVVAKAPNQKPWETHVTARPREDVLTVTVPALEPVDSSPAPVAVATPAPPTTSAAPAPAQRGGTQRAIGIAAAGVGLVGLGLGGYFSLHAMSKHDAARPECTPDETSCSSRGMVDYGAAVDSANNATVAFAVGGTLLIGGIVLWLTAPRGTAASATARTAPFVRGISF